MKRFICLLLAWIFIASSVSRAQTSIANVKDALSLEARLSSLSESNEKLRIYKDLILFYRVGDFERSFKLLQEALAYSETVSKRATVEMMLLYPAVFIHQINKTKGDPDSVALVYSQRALVKARELNDNELMGWCHLNLGHLAYHDYLNRRTTSLENYERNFNLANSIGNSEKYDSLRFSLLSFQSYVNNRQKNHLAGYRFTLEALSIAEEKYKPRWKYEALTQLSELFSSTKNYEEQRRTGMQLLELANQFELPVLSAEANEIIAEGYIWDGQNEVGMRYLKEAMSCYEKSGLDKLKEYYIGWFVRDLIVKRPNTAVTLFKEYKPYLDRFAIEVKEPLEEFTYFYLYKDNNQFDSMMIVMNRIKTKADTSISYLNHQIRRMTAQAYYAQKQYSLALPYLQQFVRDLEIRSQLPILNETYPLLETSYREIGDFSAAYAARVRWNQIQDTLREMNDQRIMLIAEIDAEKKKKEKELLEEQAQRNSRHNLQLTAISIGIGILFLFLVALGAFRISAKRIRIAGFFIFLLFFEFIFLVFKKKIYIFTQGEPWMDLAFMLSLAALMVPLHHWMEHKVVHWLSHSNISAAAFKKVWSKLKEETKIKETA